jgi:membrane protease YdiL (CAAX protease family)
MTTKLQSIVFPLLLLASTSAVFYFLSLWCGSDAGYLGGFAFYWLVWCLLVPCLITGRGPGYFFRSTQKLFAVRNWWLIALLAMTVVMPVFMYTVNGIGSLSWLVALIAIPLATIHAFFEEMFWRGFYVKRFPQDILWAVLVPSVFFSLWHLAPQLAKPTQSPALFVLSTFPLGLVYALVAYRTGAAKWSAVAHAASGVLAFSGNLAPSLDNLIRSGCGGTV